MIVSVKSTEPGKLAGAGAWPLAGSFTPGILAADGEATSAFGESSLAALLEITNRRRMGGVFNFGALGVLPSLARGALLAAEALRFNINNQTKQPSAGSEKTNNHRELAASDETGAFLAVKLELRTPED